MDSHVLRGRPPKLLLVSTGNISNRSLEALLMPLLPDLVREFGAHAGADRDLLIAKATAEVLVGDREPAGAVRLITELWNTLGELL